MQKGVKTVKNNSKTAYKLQEREKKTQIYKQGEKS